MGNKRLQPCNLSEEEIASVWDQFDDYLDGQETGLLIEYMKNYLFYHREDRGNVRECICTHDGCGRFTMERRYEKSFFEHRHGQVIRCPVCGGTVELVSLGKVRNFSKINNEKSVRFSVCRAADDGALMIVSGYARRWFSWNDLRPEPDISWKARTWLKPGKRMQWLRKPEYFSCENRWVYAWKRMAAVQEPFQPSFWGEGGDSFFLQTDQIGFTDLRYCQVEEWYTKSCAVWMDTGDDPVRNVVKYLAAYTRYPLMEMAVKLDLHMACTDLAADGLKNHRDLDWGANSIHGFLRLNKPDAKEFVRAGGNLEMLKGYHQATKDADVKSMAAYVELVKELGGIRYAADIVAMAGRAGCNIQQAVNYVRKIPGDNGRVLTLWRDYLDMAGSLGYDLTRRDVIMPKDLQDRHDAAAETISYRKRVADEARCREFNKRLRRMYEFEYGDLCIRVPGSAEEIIREGKVLHHCVGGYAARHFQEITVIVFLRHKRKPEVPFVTIELAPRKRKNGGVKVRQIHGYKNENYKKSKTHLPPNKKYAWFLDVWSQWLKDGSKRDSKGRPVLPAGKEKTA